MPVACSTSVLTGQEGQIQFKPSGTSHCLLDFTDFPVGTSITVPTNHDFQLGDSVSFTVEGSANLDSALTEATPYYVVATTASTIDVSATSGGTAITLAGDGGTGVGDTPGAANHIAISISDFQSICQVQEFSISIEREELETTSLPCGGGGGGSKYASFRASQPGYADGSGTMTVMFTADQTALANRLLGNVLLKSQEGAEVKLYVNAVSDGQGGFDDAASLYIESEIALNSMSLSVNPDDPTSAEISYKLRNPRHVLGADLT